MRVSQISLNLLIIEYYIDKNILLKIALILKHYIYTLRIRHWQNLIV